MKTCDTLSGAIRDLQQHGYAQDFNLTDHHLHCPGLELKLHPANFQVREFYRFEGETDPAAERILYAIESDEDVRGLLVSAYGAYSTPANDALLQKPTMPAV